MPALGTYSASKAAALSVTQALRADLAPKNVRVHAAFPGPIDTDMIKDFAMEKTSPADVARADRFAQIWLEKSGYDYDVISDLDLHRDPEILSGYRTFIINGHSEYWSLQACDGLEKYLKRGGNVVVLSGNSMLWRVSFNEDYKAIIICSPRKRR